VALSDSAGNRFGVKDWARCLADPDSLCSNGETLKADYGVIDVPVARPLVALRQKNGPFTTRSIYVTEYIQDSSNLHVFLRDNSTLLDQPKLALKKDLCSQIAEIFASLHNASLWHRDAKAGNFLVNQTDSGRYKLLLVDMDGIKCYGIRRQSQRFRCLSKLASTLLWHRSINMTDYLRTSTMYSNLTGLDYSKRRRVFRSLTRRAVAIRLLTMAKSAMEGAGAKKSTVNTCQKPKNILIIKPSALGDIVTALPALSSLRASFSDVKISWFVRSEYAPLFDSVDGIDDIILFDRKGLGSWWYNPRSFAALLRLISRLRRGKFNLVIDLQGLLRTAMFAWLACCKKRFGMAKSREFAGLFYTHKVPQDSKSVHVIDYYQKIVSTAGASVKSCEFNLTPTSRAIDSVAGLLTEHGIKSGRYAVFVPGSAHAFKCWPVRNFAALGEKVTSTFDLPIIVVGTSAEREIAGKLKSASKVPITNFAGLTDIPQLIALLGGATVVVSNDTGPGHIAAAVGVPVVLIFGPTNPARIRPYGRAGAVAAIEPESRGCEIESLDTKHAIENVTVEHVFEKVTYQLEHY